MSTDIQFFARGAANLLAELESETGTARRLEDPHFAIGQLMFYVRMLAELGAAEA
jgi:hypothetical protein